jgi:glycosyltransferase involved in cell wall biosynthesis
MDLRSEMGIQEVSQNRGSEISVVVLSSGYFSGQNREMSVAIQQRPMAAPGTRCLLLQLEPTPYILPRAMYVYADPELHTDLIWTYVNSSQDWGKDADIGKLPVLLDRGISPMRRVARVCKLAWKILRGRYTVAHLAGWGHWVVRVAIICCKLRGVPFSVESDTQLSHDLSGWREWLKGKIYPVILDWPAVVIPGGKRQANLFRHYGVSEDKISISHMTTDIRKINRILTLPRDEFRASVGIGADNIVVLYVGRLEPYKGVAVLLEGFEKALKQNRNLMLAVIGDGSMMQDVKNFRDRLGLSRVHIAGRQSVESVTQWMRSSEMLVLPSLHEQWGMVVNEAMTCGLPVIVSDACGCADDLVENGRTGFVFPSGDLEEFAARVLQLAADSSKREQMGLEGQRLIEPWVIERQAETIRSALVRMSYSK